MIKIRHIPVKIFAKYFTSQKAYVKISLEHHLIPSKSSSFERGVSLILKVENKSFIDPITLII